MPILQIHTYLVYPNKNIAEPRAIGGTEVALEGKVFDLLKDIYDHTERDCKIDVMFNSHADGADNQCRTLILNHLGAPSIARGQLIAERLGMASNKRSALGLLFIVVGNEDQRHKVVLARFPANSGILAGHDQARLNVEFIERVFMRSATSYKAAAYEDISTDTGFWIGKIVDRQINSRDLEVSDYWLSDFLDSSFRTTSAAGTRRLAIAIRDAARSAADLNVKNELTAVATLSPGLNGQNLNFAEFADRFGLSPQARAEVLSKFSNPELANERFSFDASEFRSQVRYRSVELNTGAILMAQATDFDNVFERERAPGSEEIIFSTRGQVINQTLEKQK